VSSLHNTELQIYSAILHPNIINIGHNLTKLLKKYKGPICIGTQCI